MKKNFIMAASLFSLSIFLPVVAQAKTVIPAYQGIAGNVIWTKEGGPYIVEGFNRVFAGSTLTIKPGTIVKLQSDAALFASGEIKVEGTAEAPVIFTSIYDDSIGGDETPWTNRSPAPGDWGGLGAESGGRLTVDHAVVKYVGYGSLVGIGMAAINNNNGQVNVSNSELTQNVRGIYNIINWYKVSVRNSKIYGNLYAGVLNLYSYGGFDATDNWWGHESGPYYANYNPSGKGNSIVSNVLKVLFDPWVGKVTNQPPVLSYTLEPGFAIDGRSQGIEPNKGVASSTDFVFKIVYTDKDNDAPKNISVVVQKRSATSSYPMELDLTAAPELHDDNYVNGEQYVVAAKFPQGKYQYYFETADEKAAVRQPAAEPLAFEVGYSNIVFLPGFEASRLFTRGLLMENQLWEPNRTSDVEKLFMDEAGTSVNPDIYTKETIDEVYNFGAFPNIYKTFLESLDGMVKNETINQAKALPYDWRMSLDDIVTGVVKTDNGGYAMTKEIEAMASSSQTGRVTIVAHSMGGLVAKRLMIRLAELGKADLVDKLILVASPQAGTPGAVAGLLHGDDQDLAFGLILDKSTAREFGENMPSAYSLLPSPRYFENADGSVIQFDTTSSLLKSMRDRYGTTIASPDGLNDFMLGREGRSEPAADDIETPNVLSEPMLDGVINLYTTIDNWTPPEGLKVIQVAGWGLDTISGIRYKERQVLKCPSIGSYFDLLRCTHEPVIDREPIFSENGDGTVMMSSAEMMKGTETYYLDIDSSNVGFRTNRKHKDILEVDSVQFLLNNLTVGQSTLPNFIYNNKEELMSGSRLRASVHSPVLLDVYDESGHHTGIIENIDSGSDLKKIEEAIPNSYYLHFGEGKYVGMNSPDTYRLELTGTGYGTFTLDIVQVTGGSETHLVYQDVPVTPLTKAQISVKTLNEKSALKIDMNGDGITDYQIGSPTETTDPLGYVNIMMQSIDSMKMDKQIINYLAVKLQVIEDLIGKDNTQAIKAQLELVKAHLAKEAGKTITQESALVLLAMIGNLNNLMIR